jgi:hypothetical protein
MAKDWQTAAAPKAAAWNIPAAALQGLDALTQTADAALTAAKNETTRTPAKSLRLLAWSLAAGAVLYV